MAESRSALVVATYAYDDVGLTRLKAPARDAEALSEVLADPAIGGFEVRTVVNQPSHVVTLEVARFFANRKPDELLLLHFSCHGVKDDSGELYFASTDTRLDLLEASAVSSAFVNKVMTRSRSSRVVLLLDCCYAGAFARGLVPRATAGLDLGERLAGRGRAVLTASTALQFAFEGTDLAAGDLDKEQPSVFTRALVTGLRTGEADRDLDGLVSLDELYGYVYDEVTATTPHQTPGKWVLGLEGDLYLARRSTQVTSPSDLEQEVVDSVESAVPWQRGAVVPELERLLRGSHPGRALAARQALERLADDDSRQVATAARRALAGHLPEQRTSSEQLTVAIPAQTHTDPRARSEPPPDLRPEVRPDPDIESAVQGGSTAGNGTIERTDPLPPGGSWPRNGRRPRSGWAAAGGALVVLVLIGGLVGWVVSRNDAGPPAPLPDTTVLLSEFVDGRARLVAVDATTGRRISTFPRVEGRRPSISPDRQWVIYAAGEDAVTDWGSKKFVLHRMRPDGSGQRPWLKPTADCRFASRPTWNPEDTSQLAVTCLDSDGDEQGIWTVSEDGTLEDQLVADPRIQAAPTWTGNDTLIYAVSRDSVNGPSTTLGRVHTDREEPADTLETESGLSTDWSYFDPDWSDNGLLLTRANGYREPGTVLVRAPAGAEVTPWPGLGDDTQYATWSPDGRAVAWLTSQGPRRFTLRTGDGERQVKGIEGALEQPAWGSR